MRALLLAGGALASVVASASAGPASVGAASPEVAPGQDHACTVGSPPPGGVDWAGLHNPILPFPTRGVKGPPE